MTADMAYRHRFFKCFRGMLLAGLGLLPLTDFSRAFAADNLVTKAPIAFLSAPDTGTILFAKEPNRSIHPGSLVKIMTAATVFNALSDGEINAETLCSVSEHAWRTGGAPSRSATMFAAINSDISVMDLLRGLLVHNANDAAIVLAECLDGSEGVFAERMNDTAKAIGMMNSRFSNPTGFENASDQSDSIVTAADLARLAAYIIREHSGPYALFSQGDFTWNKIFQRNKNPMLGEIRGLDGFGAGQSPKDGYSALSSVNRDGRRVIAVVAGLPSASARLASMKSLVEGAWEYFQVKTLYRRGETVAEARVHGGLSSAVPLIASADVDVLLPRGETLDYRLRVVYDGPLKAPVKPGMEAGELRVIGVDGVVHRSRLITGAAVGSGKMSKRALDGLQELLLGWF